MVLTDNRIGLAKQPTTERTKKAKATKPMTRFLGKGQRPIGTMIIMAHTSSVYATLFLALSPPASPQKI
ncbi:MAG: hypothetical protein DME45_07335 [Verrucomicrobia bacterium]|nr:MAG: hypothetical protein DME45_07335 [Verrucomicrobiota bacterium]